ncbi:MAG: pantetheine-phosphate adenylyltransferase [Proteobacteria bacterium]|nr:pantetheine-phosphate adenylyltransferase [Pseudomonadota bacterium]NOG60648.1 pantetheine-phosphate adenylyltransferase [Pseudomonadota bacterium]
MVTAVYPGTFDPVTNGHADIAERAASMFEKVIVAVADSETKNTLFTVNERVELANHVLSEIKNVEVVSFNSLVTDLAKDKKAKVIIRGIRAVSDFDYEFQMAGMNRQLLSSIETVFLTPAEKLSFISSSLVREISSFNGDVSEFVHEAVVSALKEKHQ